MESACENENSNPFRNFAHSTETQVFEMCTGWDSLCSSRVSVTFVFFLMAAKTMFKLLPTSCQPKFSHSLRLFSLKLNSFPNDRGVQHHIAACLVSCGRTVFMAAERWQTILFASPWLALVRNCWHFSSSLLPVLFTWFPSWAASKHVCNLMTIRPSWIVFILRRNCFCKQKVFLFWQKDQSLTPHFYSFC